MTISARSIAVHTDFRHPRALRWIFAAAALAAVAAPAAAEAAARIARPGTYDGVWNVLFATQAGNCTSSNSVPLTVIGTRVSSPGDGKVTAGPSRGASLVLNIPLTPPQPTSQPPP